MGSPIKFEKNFLLQLPSSFELLGDTNYNINVNYKVAERGGNEVKA